MDEPKLIALLAKACGELDAMKRLMAAFISATTEIDELQSAWQQALPEWIEQPAMEQLFADVPAYREAHLRTLAQLSLAIEQQAKSRGG